MAKSIRTAHLWLPTNASHTARQEEEEAMVSGFLPYPTLGIRPSDQPAPQLVSFYAFQDWSQNFI